MYQEIIISTSKANMGTHKCTLNDLQLKKIEEAKARWLKPPSERKKKVDPKNIPANHNDFIFDRENRKIVKKGQMELL